MKTKIYLAQSLIGKSIGSTIPITTPEGKTISYKITNSEQISKGKQKKLG